ncbi:hypothetical protein A4X06_0g7046, partial [Tilletia controversa]
MHIPSGLSSLDPSPFGATLTSVILPANGFLVPRRGVNGLTPSSFTSSFHLLATLYFPQAIAEVRSIAQPTTKRWTVDVLFHSSQLLCSLLPQTPHTYLPPTTMLHPRFLFLLPYLFVLLATVVNSAPVPRTTDCPSCSGLPRTLQSRGFLSSLFGCFKGAAEVEHTGPDP